MDDSNIYFARLLIYTLFLYFKQIYIYTRLNTHMILDKFNDLKKFVRAVFEKISKIEKSFM